MSLLNAVAEQDPIGKTKQLSVRLRPDVHETLKAAADRGKTSVNELLGRLVETAADLPSYAMAASRSFDGLLHSPQVMTLLRAVIDDHLNKKLPDWVQDELHLPLDIDDVVVKDVSFWPGSIEFSIRWEIKELTRTVTWGEHNSWQVRVCRGGQLYFGREKLSATDDTVRVDILEGSSTSVTKPKSKKPKPPNDDAPPASDGFIDDDLPF